MSKGMGEGVGELHAQLEPSVADFLAEFLANANFPVRTLVLLLIGLVFRLFCRFVLHLLPERARFGWRVFSVGLGLAWVGVVLGALLGAVRFGGLLFFLGALAGLFGLMAMQIARFKREKK